MTLAEDLASAVNPTPPECMGLLVKLLDLRHENYPGRDARGILPIVVTGHEGMSERDWSKWVRENAVINYGPAQAERFVETGVDLKEMLPTAPFGRAMRLSRTEGWRSTAVDFRYLDQAGLLISMVEQWPSLYNLIAENMAEEQMTLRELVDRIRALPSPWEVGKGRMITLGDLIGRTAVLTPNW